jgi:hypothetical protein
MAAVRAEAPLLRGMRDDVKVAEVEPQEDRCQETEADAELLPGGAVGRPISARQLMRRLNRLGIRARLARNTALMDLAAQLPATVLADLLILRTGTATAWNEAAGNTRSGYAAGLSRRPGSTR